MVRLGQVTAESQARPENEGDHGFLLGLGGVYLGLETMERKLGTALGLGGWFETRYFAFGQSAYISNFADAQDGAFGALDIGLLVHYLIRRGNVSPLFGAGLKVRTPIFNGMCL